MTTGIARDQLKSFIDRIERLEAQKQEIAEDVKRVYVELADDGFDPKIVRKVIALRKKSANERAEEEMVLATYLAALGEQLPLFEDAA